MTFKVSFLGVRGSTPCAGPEFVKYGGHTSCVMVEIEDQVFFLDAGSGIITGNSVALKLQETHLLFSHVHLDHVMGFPFFMPIWRKDIITNVYAGNLTFYGGILKFLENFFREPLFPLEFKNFPGDIRCHDFEPGCELSFNHGIKIDTTSLNHPNGAVGYRINYQGKSLCYVTDTEHLEDSSNQNILDLIHGTDLFIYDSTYSDTNYPNYKGWGHSTWQEALRLGVQANVGKTVIFHHDPYNNDDRMAQIEIEVLERNPKAIVAKQGMTFDLISES